MYTDYALIANRAAEIIGSADPSQYELAYDAMKLETITVSVTEDVKVNEATILTLLGTSAGIVLIDKLSAIHPSIARLLQGDGISVTNPESKIHALLLGEGVLTQAEHDWIVSFYTKEVPVWEGLKPGHVQNALQGRLEGRY